MAHRVLAVLAERERSVAWLARQIGFSVSYTWRVLNGERRATDDFKARVSAALELSADDLFKEADR